MTHFRSVKISVIEINYTVSEYLREYIEIGEHAFIINKRCIYETGDEAHENNVSTTA